jgi:hypothetical protein
MVEEGSKIIRAVSVLICFHFVEGGKPLNCCAIEEKKIKTNASKKQILTIKKIVQEN